VVTLATHFAKKYSEMNSVPHREIDDAAMEKLKRNPWRGNVRELENTIHRAVLLAHGNKIGAEAILMPDGTAVPETVHSTAALPGKTNTSALAADSPDSNAMVGRTVADVEKVLILNTLEHCLGNRTHAATILGISIRTLRNKLKLYSGEGIQIPSSGAGQRSAI